MELTNTMMWLLIFQNEKVMLSGLFNDALEPYISYRIKLSIILNKEIWNHRCRCLMK